MGWRALAAFACSLSFGHALAAQRVVSSVDVSGTGVWYADSIRATGGSLNPAVRLDWPRATIAASGTVSELGGGGGNMSLQGLMAPSVFTPSIGPFTLELAAQLGGSTHQDGTRTGQAIGFTRAYIMGNGSGAWAGGGAGRSWDGAIGRNVRQGELGAWLEQRGVTALASVSPVIVQDTIRYTDLQAAVRYPMDRVELGFSVGTRSGSVGPVVGGTSRTWGTVSVLTWLTPGIALVGSAGNYPVDLTQGYPGGRFVSLALRLASRNTRQAERAASTSSSSDTPLTVAAEATNTAGVSGFVVGQARGGSRILRVQAASAGTVEVNGDFTHWKPIQLSRAADGWWNVTLPIATGTHQLNVRVDGGPWVVPPGLLSTTDEFGGIVGILVIE
jgi:hypothetical protein